MNIAEILKYCPEGTRLYSLLHGEVFLGKVFSSELDYPIEVFTTTQVSEYFTKDGLFNKCFSNGECILFPSKEQRDWNKFKLPIKKGDIMMDIEGECPFIATGKLDSNGNPTYICGINSLGNFQLNLFDRGWTSGFYIPASEEVKKELFDKMEEAGCKWNADILELEKIERKFKEGDVIIDKKGSIFLISKILNVGSSTLEIAAILNKESLTINPNIWLKPCNKSIASEEAKKELFIKMKRAGYKWNADTLELEKIEPKFKEGDVLINKNTNKLFLFTGGIINDVIQGYLLFANNTFEFYGLPISSFKLASSEDRDKVYFTLAKKGYKYDREQHRLIKQEFKPFDKVLTRDSENEEWSINLFSYYDEKNKHYPYVCLCNRYSECIPYEGNEYLVGKTSNIK